MSRKGPAGLSGQPPRAVNTRAVLQGCAMAIIECVPNVSEGRRPDVVRAIVDAVAATPGVHLLDWSSDASHNRSVITLAGDAAPLKAAVLTLFERSLAVDRLAAAPGRASAHGRRRRRAVRADRGRDDGRLRAAGARDGRGGRGAVRRARCSSTRRRHRRPRGETSKTSAAASSKGWRRRWQQPAWQPDFGPCDAAPERRRHGHRRPHAAHRLQHQPRDRPPRRREEDRGGDPPQQRRPALRQGDGRSRSRTAASCRCR